MHEWAISENLLNHALARAAKEGVSKISRIGIEVGELRQADPDILRFALEQLKKETIAESAQVDVVRIPASFSCRHCGNRWDFSEEKQRLTSEMGSDNPVHYVPDFIYVFMRCPRCDSPDFEIISGRDIGLSVRVEI